MHVSERVFKAQVNFIAAYKAMTDAYVSSPDSDRTAQIREYERTALKLLELICYDVYGDDDMVQGLLTDAIQHIRPKLGLEEE